MRPRALRRRLALAAFGAILAGATIGTGIARADGYISDVEADWITLYGDPVICGTLDEFPSKSGIMGVGSVIMEDGFAPDDAADIVNATVAVFCPEYGSLLGAVGREARGNTPISGGIGGRLV